MGNKDCFVFSFGKYTGNLCGYKGIYKKNKKKWIIKNTTLLDLIIYLELNKR